MTWPFENDTSFIEKKIASRSFRRDRMRNLFVVTAIILTTVLFQGCLHLEQALQRVHSGQIIFCPAEMDMPELLI